MDYVGWAKDEKWVDHIDHRVVIQQNDEWFLNVPKFIFFKTGRWPSVWFGPQRDAFIVNVPDNNDDEVDDNIAAGIHSREVLLAELD